MIDEGHEEHKGARRTLYYEFPKIGTGDMLRLKELSRSFQFCFSLDEIVSL